MASSRPTVGEVEISAFVKIDQRSVADGIKSIESQAKRAGSAVTKLNRPLGEITGNVTEFSKSLEASNARVLAFGASAGAIYALSRSFKFLVDSMIQVEKELKDINVISLDDYFVSIDHKNQIYNLNNIRLLIYSTILFDHLTNCLLI